MRVKPRLAQRDESAGQHVPDHGLGADHGRVAERVADGAGLSCGGSEKERLGFKRPELATADRWGDTGSRKHRGDRVLVRYLGRARAARTKPQAPAESDDVARRWFWRIKI